MFKIICIDEMDRYINVYYNVDHGHTAIVLFFMEYPEMRFIRCESI